MTEPKKASTDDITEANKAVSRGGHSDDKQEPKSGPRIGHPAAGMALAVEAEAGKGETEKALDRATDKGEAGKR
jgi:hypothetical protein